MLYILYSRHRLCWPVGPITRGWDQASAPLAPPLIVYAYIFFYKMLSNLEKFNIERN
jgi:hypothetical protein